MYCVDKSAMIHVPTLEEYTSVYDTAQSRDLFLTFVVAKDAASAEERLEKQKHQIDALELEIGDLRRQLRTAEREKKAALKLVDAAKEAGFVPPEPTAAPISTSKP